MGEPATHEDVERMLKEISDHLDRHFGELCDRFDGLAIGTEARVNNVEARVGTVEVRVNNVHRRIELMEARLVAFFRGESTSR